MATVLSCADLANAVATQVVNRFPPVVPLALQIFSCAPFLTFPANAGNVYAGNYGGIAPVFNPGAVGAVATDTVTRRQWQFNGSVWT